MCRHSNGIQVSPSALGSRTSPLVSAISRGSTSHTSGSCTPSDEGLILDSRNTVLLERPLPSPALNTKRVQGASSVMYITVRWERQYHAYVLGR